MYVNKKKRKDEVNFFQEQHINNFSDRSLDFFSGELSVELLNVLITVCATYTTV